MKKFLFVLFKYYLIILKSIRLENFNDNYNIFLVKIFYFLAQFNIVNYGYKYESAMLMSASIFELSDVVVSALVDISPEPI